MSLSWLASNPLNCCYDAEGKQNLIQMLRTFVYPLSGRYMCTSSRIDTFASYFSNFWQTNTSTVQKNPFSLFLPNHGASIQYHRLYSASSFPATRCSSVACRHCICVWICPEHPVNAQYPAKHFKWSILLGPFGCFLALCFQHACNSFVCRRVAAMVFICKSRHYYGYGLR